jgi:hypothetical protein
MKYVVISTNEVPKYRFYQPLVEWAWRKLDWGVITFNVGIECGDNRWPVECSGYKSETVAQVSRLYGACVTKPGDYLMTSDVDMLPLSDYWKPKFDDITCYGRDLTDYHYPICYIGMNHDNWSLVMDLDGPDYDKYISQDLIFSRQSKNVWCFDQDLITKNINKTWHRDKLTLVDRGTDKRTGYPIGRVDRSNWRLDHSVLIDAHLPHDILTSEDSFKKVINLLHTVWPSEDFKWFIQYYKDFKKTL